MIEEGPDVLPPLIPALLLARSSGSLGRVRAPYRSPGGTMWTTLLASS